MGSYVEYFNTQRPCYAICYDTPEIYRKNYYRGDLEKKDTLSARQLTTEPKFVQKKREHVKNLSSVHSWKPVHLCCYRKSRHRMVEKDLKLYL